MRGALLLALLIMFLPLAQAGTSDDPEISDADDDGHPMAEKDLVKVWIEETEVGEGDPALWFQIATGGDFEHVPAFFALHERYRIAFKVNAAGADEWYLSISPSRANMPAPVTAIPGAGDETVSCRLASAPAGSAAPLADEVSMTSTFEAANQFGCVVPYANLGLVQGDSVTGLYAEHIQVARGPLSGGAPTGGDNIPYTVLATYDRAPDSGYEVYETPLPAMNGTGNETGNQTGNGTGNQTGNGTGNQTFPGGDGNTTTDGGCAECPDGGGPTGNTTGNETTNDTSDDKESPGVALPIMVAFIAAIAVVRRIKD